MHEPVNPRRRYHSPQRQLQARATRRQIVDAATRLFSQHGFFGTTIGAIAQAADVAEPTVYASFGNKRAILAALIDLAIFGPDPPRTPVQQRSWYPEISTITDPADLLRRWAALLCEVNARVAPVQRIVQNAAASDPEVAQLWQRMKDQRLTGQLSIAQLLAERQALRPDLSPNQAADVLFVLSDAHVYDAYLLERGWSPAQIADWLGKSLCALLLPGR